MAPRTAHRRGGLRLQPELDSHGRVFALRNFPKDYYISIFTWPPFPSSQFMRVVSSV